MLKDYDYIYYLDADMRMVTVVGDEVLPEKGLLACLHPMYAFRKEYIAPYEPNTESTAYIKTPQYYYAGGFQGGKTKPFIEAMKRMKKNIDTDFDKINYMARWNDESHWNTYLFKNPPEIVLSPAYIYPDSLIEDYYVKLWGTNYNPRIVTLTKPFSLTKEGGEAVLEHIKTT